MVDTLYTREGAPYELNEVMFILWNLRHWGVDAQAIEDIAKLVQRRPAAIRALLHEESHG